MGRASFWRRGAGDEGRRRRRQSGCRLALLSNQLCNTRGGCFPPVTNMDGRLYCGSGRYHGLGGSTTTQLHVG